jgi:hypothetical protein
MESPLNLNPLMHIWRTIPAFQALTHSFFEYLKLVKMAIVHVLGSVEDECCFSTLTFLNSKLHVILHPHLPSCS